MRHSTNPAPSCIASAPTLALEVPKMRGAAPVSKTVDEFDRVVTRGLKVIVFFYYLILMIAVVGYTFFLIFVMVMALLIYCSALLP